MKLEEFFKDASGGCQSPGCDHKGHGELFLHSQCHPSAGTRVSVNVQTRVIQVSCAVCSRLVAKVECPFVN